MAISRNPKSLKILKNCVPEASLRALLKKTPKMLEKVIFPEGWICNPHTPVQSKHTFSFLLSSGPRLPKRIQKASQNRAFEHPNHKKNRKTNTQKKHYKMDAKSIKNGSKNEVDFRGGEVCKITKIRALGSNCAPSLQDGFPDS